MRKDISSQLPIEEDIVKEALCTFSNRSSHVRRHASQDAFVDAFRYPACMHRALDSHDIHVKTASSNAAVQSLHDLLKTLENSLRCVGLAGTAWCWNSTIAAVKGLLFKKCSELFYMAIPGHWRHNRDTLHLS